MAGFKITNMSFNYSEMKVNIQFNAEFESGDILSGNVGLTMEEFNANTTGLAGYANLVKEKLVKNFNEMTEKEQA
ncbi:hypothetical protein [Enterococcus gallinarum]|uniref:hypothetical protein n=1 Tax=Enterococcus gallinarum TaxID=1353 RepID=UPI0015C56768|nr:hypothetical protein [Enterococcus gallinarum]MDT2686576.1 hypothetical protein [Enterococcus gallinarum]NQE02925.1 hypothetical protein [Enterococcus gallinarum]